MATPKLRREQVAGMNIHYVNYSLDYFLDAQQRIGFKASSCGVLRRMCGWIICAIMTRKRSAAR